MVPESNPFIEKSYFDKFRLNNKPSKEHDSKKLNEVKSCLELIVEEQTHNLQKNVNNLLKADYELVYMEDYPYNDFPKVEFGDTNKYKPNKYYPEKGRITIDEITSLKCYEEVHHASFFTKKFKDIIESGDKVDGFKDLTSTVNGGLLLTFMHYTIGSLMNLITPKDIPEWKEIKNNNYFLDIIIEDAGYTNLNGVRIIENIVMKHRIRPSKKFYYSFVKYVIDTKF